MLEDKIRKAVNKVLPIHYEDGKAIMRGAKNDKAMVEEVVADIMRAIHKAYDKYSEPLGWEVK